jgi:4-amino-4-deoxy-L-arabinose transferase-like glycosyltransferase
MTLRGAVTWVVALLAAITLVALGWAASSDHPSVYAVGWLGGQLVILFLVLVFERFRYKAIDPSAPGPGFEASGERFIDPESGQPVDVWYNPDSGERRYVASRR